MPRLQERVEAPTSGGWRGLGQLGLSLSGGRSGRCSQSRGCLCPTQYPAYCLHRGVDQGGVVRIWGACVQPNTELIAYTELGVHQGSVVREGSARVQPNTELIAYTELGAHQGSVFREGSARVQPNTELIANTEG